MPALPQSPVVNRAPCPHVGDGATEKCGACGYMNLILAPESARLGQREQVEDQPAESSSVDVYAEMARAHKAKAEQVSAPRVISFDEIRRRNDGR